MFQINQSVKFYRELYIFLNEYQENILMQHTWVKDELFLHKHVHSLLRLECIVSSGKI